MHSHMDEKVKPLTLMHVGNSESHMHVGNSESRHEHVMNGLEQPNNSIENEWWEEKFVRRPA